MVNSDLETFAESYIDIALKTAHEYLSFEYFYRCVFARVSDRTRFTLEQINYLHNAFHWVLFLKPYSPLELVHPNRTKGESKVKIKSNPIEKNILISNFFSEYGPWLEGRFGKTLKNNGSNTPAR